MYGDLLCCAPKANTTLYINYTPIKKKKGKKEKRNSEPGNSLAVQWLGLGAFMARGLGSIPGEGTKILQAAWQGQKKKEKRNSQPE